MMMMMMMMMMMVMMVSKWQYCNKLTTIRYYLMYYHHWSDRRKWFVDEQRIVVNLDQLTSSSCYNDCIGSSCDYTKLSVIKCLRASNSCGGLAGSLHLDMSLISCIAPLLSLPVDSIPKIWRGNLCDWCLMRLFLSQSIAESLVISWGERMYKTYITYTRSRSISMGGKFIPL